MLLEDQAVTVKVQGQDRIVLGAHNGSRRGSVTQGSIMRGWPECGCPIHRP